MSGFADLDAIKALADEFLAEAESFIDRQREYERRITIIQERRKED